MFLAPVLSLSPIRPRLFWANQAALNPFLRCPLPASSSSCVVLFLRRPLPASSSSQLERHAMGAGPWRPTPLVSGEPHQPHDEAADGGW